MTRKLTFLILALFALISGPGWGQNQTIYHETFGTVEANTDYSPNAANLSDENSSEYITTYASWKFSKNTTSPCNLAGSSGSSHIFCGSNGKDLVLTFGNLTEYSSATLSFNYKNEAGKGKDRTITVKISSDGGANWSNNILASNTTQDWTAVNYELSETNKANFAVKFSTTAANASRIDDIILAVSGSTPSTTFTVTYDGNDNTSGTVPTDENEYESGATVTVLGNTGNLAKTNYTWAGWNTQADGEGTPYQANETFNITANTTLYAQWIADPKYVLTYNANGGVGDDIVEQHFNGEVISIANCTFTYEGHVFTNWNTAADGSGTPYEAGVLYTMTTDGLILYAQWEEALSTTYIFNTDAGLSALGITKPSAGAGTNLGNSAYVSGDISMTATDGSTPTRVWNSAGATDLRIYSGGGSLTFSIAGGNIVKIELTGNTVNGFSCGETGTFSNGIWTGASSSVTLTATGTQKINTIEVTYKPAQQTKVTAPAITPNGGNVYNSQSVSISCSTDGATILYTTDDGANWYTYVNSFNVEGESGTATVKAKATLAGMEDSDEVSATFTFAQTYTSVAAVNAITEYNIPIIISMNNWTITSFSGNNLYVTDGTTDNPTIHIFDYNIPDTYTLGGKLTGSLKAIWVKYNDEGEVATVQNWNEINYSAPTFTINIDEDLENGTIVATPTTATAGTEISFSVTPDEGYRMTAESLSVKRPTGESVTFSGSNPYAFTMPNSDVTISAEFELLPTKTYQYLYSVNGISGDELEAYEGESITLVTSENLNDDFTFAGWTTDENDVENILAAGSSYIVNDEVIFYAVYAKEGQCIGEKTVILDGSTLPSTATTEETTHTIDGVSYKFSAGAKKQPIQTEAVNYFKDGDAVLIGKSGAYIYNDNPFGEGITKFEIYANKGASAKVSVGVYFSTIAITEYATDESTWTETLSTVDNVYDASGKLPDGAKYFWYQVTNANNSQIQFRITYKEQTATTKYYTRVYDENTTIYDNLTVAGPSIIMSGKTLTVTGTMINTDPANLIIEDGAQLFQNSSDVMATVRKNITGYTGDNDNYYLIANPTDNATVAHLTENNYDLYTFDPTQAFEWHYEKESNTLTSGIGYLYANSRDVILQFAGELMPAGEATIDDLKYYDGNEAGRDFPGFNLIGNPYTCNVYLNKDAYVLNGDDFVSIDAGTAIAPCQGFFVEATQVDKSVTLSTTDPSNTSRSLNLTVSQNRGNVIDRAIVNFNGSNNLHKFMMNPAHTNLSIAKGGETFAAISTEAEGELPMNFKAEKNGTYTITVDTKNVDAEYLHLIDNMTGMDVDLLATPSYTFDAKTSDYASRFKLVFGVKNEASESSDSSFAFMSNGNLVIDNIEGEATLQIVDELGRVISTETVSGSYNKALNLKAGLYIINLNGMTQKIVVK